MLVSVDANALEWKVVTELDRDPVAIQEILEKKDVHSINQAAFNLPSRLISKKYLFRTIFNHGNGYAFTVDPEFMHVSTSVKYWDEVGEKFYNKYVGLEEMYQRNMQTVASGKPLEGPLGRFWPLEMVTDYKGELKIPETKVVNYPVQGTAADVMMIARISFYNRLKKKSWGHLVKLITTVHDSIYVDCPKELALEIVAMFYAVFEDLPKNIYKLFGYEWIVPLSCECSMGINMRDMEAINM